MHQLPDRPGDRNQRSQRRCVLPNLYFHVTVVYALLRSAGVALGKQDFEGTPAYQVMNRRSQ